MGKQGGLRRADGSAVRLSTPIGDIKPHYDVVVVGSGYGGGIAASRLARAGRTVCLLERGRELQPGDYPDTLLHAAREMQVHSSFGHVGKRTALFDFHAGKGITALVGCGLGGTSLINANVGMQAETDVFAKGWPAAFANGTDPELLKGYERARAMLRPTRYPDDGSYPALAKMAAHKQAADALGEQYTATDIYVTFKDRVNEAGIVQAACTNCGDCVSGCNYGAKNTVLMNYLPDAVNNGAEIFTECAVHHVSPRPEAGWAVHYDADKGRRRYRRAPREYVTADIVVLAAGTIGSTEILLRSRAAGLPMSDRLGEKFTGNADMLAFAYDADVPVHGVGKGRRKPPYETPVGPCITSMIDLRDRPGVKDSLVIQEGVMPGALSPIMPLTFLAANAVEGNNFGRSILTRLRRAARQVLSLVQGVRRGPIDRTQTYLVMGTDDDDGHLVLKKDSAHIVWPKIGERPIFRRTNCDLENTATAIGATYLPNPAWQLLRKELVTVHPLGGCTMADDAAFG